MALEGFSLHANTHLHANDRQGLERPCRYGASGALALERLSRAEDGRIAWRMKRPLPDGTTHLLFTGLELLGRLASLVPPPRTNLARFHGVFAPGARVWLAISSSVAIRFIGCSETSPRTTTAMLDRD